MQTRTPGITIDLAGRRLIDKEHRGIRICARLGRVSQCDAEARLRAVIARADAKLQSDLCRRPRFLDCATHYLAESRFKRSARVIDWHVRLLNAHIGQLEIDRVHDGTSRLLWRNGLLRKSALRLLTEVSKSFAQS